MWILGRVEERGWIYKTLIIRMISVQTVDKALLLQGFAIVGTAFLI